MSDLVKPLVPLCTLRAGERFRLPDTDIVAEVGFQSPKMALMPQGQLMVEVFDG